MAIQFTACVTVSGQVCTVQYNIFSFTLLVNQNMEGASPVGSLQVCGLMPITHNTIPLFSVWCATSSTSWCLLDHLWHSFYLPVRWFTYYSRHFLFLGLMCMHNVDFRKYTTYSNNWYWAPLCILTNLISVSQLYPQYFYSLLHLLSLACLQTWLLERQARLTSMGLTASECWDGWNQWDISKMGIIGPSQKLK